MNKKDLVKACLITDDAIETYPFKDKTYSEYAIIRHKSNNKWFAIIFHMDGKLCLNLKCNPIEGAILRDNYDYITSGWHMNKTHWIKVDVNKAPTDLLENLIKASYDLTTPKQGKKKEQI